MPLTKNSTSKKSLAILLDVDNTLLDNDHFSADLRAHLLAAFGPEQCDRYWKIYEQRRDEAGYADYLGTLQRFRSEARDNPALLHAAQFMLEYPFADRVYPQAIETLVHLRTFASTTIVSDGDIVFQPRKIRRSGIWQAVDGRVLIFIHKQHELAAIQQHCPADHYVMVEDKPHLLAAMKREMGTRLTTVFVRQGHYARDAASDRIDPLPDRVFENIGDLRQCKREDFMLEAVA